LTVAGLLGPGSIGVNSTRTIARAGGGGLEDLYLDLVPTELPRFRENPDEYVTRERIEAFNDAIAEQAEDYDVRLVDLDAEPVEDDLVSDKDGFHPNDEGHRRIADEFLKVILPALGLAPTT
jgi:lysophospholipase L1-like esterase